MTLTGPTDGRTKYGTVCSDSDAPWFKSLYGGDAGTQHGYRWEYMTVLLCGFLLYFTFISSSSQPRSPKDVVEYDTDNWLDGVPDSLQWDSVEAPMGESVEDAAKHEKHDKSVFRPLSPQCRYRGHLSGHNCSCLRIPKGPAIAGDKCESVSCGRTTMEQCSAHTIAPAFDEVAKRFGKECKGEKHPSKACRQMVMKLRDSLNIFGFSYFPIQGLKLKWRSITRCVPYHTKIHIVDHVTNDPVLVLMQYTQALYQVWGGAGPARHGRSPSTASRGSVHCTAPE